MTAEEIIRRLRVLSEQSAALDHEDRKALQYVLQRFIDERRPFAQDAGQNNSAAMKNRTATFENQKGPR